MVCRDLRPATRLTVLQVCPKVFDRSPPLQVFTLHDLAGSKAAHVAGFFAHRTDQWVSSRLDTNDCNAPFGHHSIPIVVSNLKLPFGTKILWPPRLCYIAKANVPFTACCRSSWFSAPVTPAKDQPECQRADNYEPLHISPQKLG
jgi:hypothetical protein